ncbi:MAG: diadenylate cyclase [Oceanidesulfovibrio sp.]
MAASRIGALVVLQKSVPLGDVVEKGVRLDAKVSKDLLVTIFYPNTPLHDGAVIMQGGVLVAAACILPLSAASGHRSDLGTRHRAGIGITEETDAVAVVVSEERGRISVAHQGAITVCPDEARLREVLMEKLAA